ncbi:transcriptional regulator with XRE-family HTH domain [Spinactinospora alkalitolerans]|uniref:Transcriptional regulator with XRE-family HTH domain n=1 Tax=Spinactinospora alkalitolerans TaxID=687207 RepID=A0A852TWC6_9ACTN|nr:helix-turn-helix transcriptional regulator [Spinactinospora alkalitolerans]NYE47617.1 transcriptional regulator with XRE-family HTH domain [Spinactinospora alkalitolerans]
MGELIRQWRERRRLSQLQLSIQADVSTRHLSFVETGRSRPSRDMVLHLAEELDLPLRERNHLLLAAGYAPVYAETALESPKMAAVRGAVSQILRGHEPYPAVVVDRAWNMVDANAAVALFTGEVAAELMAPPVNVLRVSLHPDGMAPRILNLGEWRGHLLARLRRQVALTGDADLGALHDELAAYPGARSGPAPEAPGPGDLAVPLRVAHEGAELTFISTVATFGTPLDVTVAELAIESFLPADRHTADVLRRWQAGRPQQAAPH